MRSPILFLIFNRPDTTEKVFEEIRKAKPPRLYVAADGPRKNREGEKERCEETRAIVSKVDWDCQVNTLFRDENLGCGKAVSEAITWFFDNEPEGIILEDDILPHQDFFQYCDELLEKYRNNKQIGIISGACHIYENLSRKASYGFLSTPHIWGWATWKYNWDKYLYNIHNIPMSLLVKSLKKYGYKSDEIRFWKMIYHTMKQNKIDTWDYQWCIALLTNEMINIFPYKSLTRNIGFNEDATHTQNARQEELEMKTYPIYPIIHPKTISLDRDADIIDIQNGSRTIHFSKYLKMRLKSRIKSILCR